MPTTPFDFLLEMPDAEATQWLRGYLRGEFTTPAIHVPFDFRPLDFLLSRVHPLTDRALPERVGTLSGKLLAEAIAVGAHRRGEGAELEALFALAESLPVADEVAEFLNDLAISSRLLVADDGDTDLHLLALRALAMHQRHVPGEVSGLIEFWQRHLADIRYAPIALQGLLRISACSAIQALPEFVRRARAADPPLPLANTLFAVVAELGGDAARWSELGAVFQVWPEELAVVQQVLGQVGLAESDPAAWAALASRVARQPETAPGIRMVYAGPKDTDPVRLAHTSVRNRPLLSPLAA